MKTLTLCVSVCLGAAVAQTPPAPPSPAAPAPAVAQVDPPGDTVVAIFDDGTKLTMDEYRNIVSVLQPQQQAAAQQQRELFLQQWAVYRKIERLAEQDKLDQQSPQKEQLAYVRMMTLYFAKANKEMNSVTVSAEDIAKFYDEHKEDFKEVKTKAIYISFSKTAVAPTSSSATASRVKKTLTEDEAKAKAQKLLADIRAGADFVKLVKENSDDETSKEKDGDLVTFRPGETNIPEDFKVVFKLKQGETTEPVRQASGFYLLRADQVDYLPLANVRDRIYQQLRGQKGNAWMQKIAADTKVTFPDPGFIGKPPAPAVPPPPAPSK